MELKYTAKQARNIIKNLTPKDIKNLNWQELVALATAGQREIRNDIRRFQKAGVSSGAYALNAFKRATTPHTVKYSYYSIKERKVIKKEKEIVPEVRYMARINEKKSTTGLEIYLNKLQNYFSDDTKTNTIEGIKRHQRYVRFFMGGGEVVEDENGLPIDYIPEENFTQEEVDRFYAIYEASKERFGKDFSVRYESIRDAIVFIMRNKNDDFRDKSAEEVADWLLDNPNFITDPSGIFGGDDSMK